MKPQTPENALRGRAARQRSTVGLLLAGVLLSSPAHAYIDPGTGSMILQGLLAGIAVAIGVARTYWQRIKAFFSGSSATTEISANATQETDGEDAKAQSEV